MYFEKQREIEKLSFRVMEFLRVAGPFEVTLFNLFILHVKNMEEKLSDIQDHTGSRIGTLFGDQQLDCFPALLLQLTWKGFEMIVLSSKEFLPLLG